MTNDWWQPELPFSPWPMDWRKMKATKLRKLFARTQEECFWHVVSIDPSSRIIEKEREKVGPIFDRTSESPTP